MENKTTNTTEKSFFKIAAEGNEAIAMKEAQSWATGLMAAGGAVLMVVSVVLRLTRG